MKHNLCYKILADPYVRLVPIVCTHHHHHHHHHHHPRDDDKNNNNNNNNRRYRFATDDTIDMATSTTTTTTTATTPLNAQTRELVLENDPDAQQHCLVCYDTLEHTTKTPCQHDEICGVCHLRIRFLHQDKKCPICKTENNQVIVDQNEDPGSHAKTFDMYPIWGDNLGSDFHYEEDVGMFFRREYYESEIKPLFGYHCTVPNCDYDGLVPDKAPQGEQQQPQQGQNIDSNINRPKNTPKTIRGLQDHLRVKHRLTLCNLCVEHQRDFVARLPRFSPSKLKEHLTKGDGRGSGFEGHPLCEFCRPKRFYDLNDLHQHLNRDHYKCHCCENQGLPNQFFKNYKSLEKHFDTRHFLCHDVQCLQARFVVFSNELDLRHHERQVHGGTSTGSSKIQLEFRLRRPTSTSEEAPSESDFNYDLDGQAFVPDNLPQTHSNDSRRTPVQVSNLPLHPLHVQRTAQLREQAAEWREANNSVEAFPTLEASLATEINNASGTPSLNFGWASNATLSRLSKRPDVGAVTEEAFPSLGPSEGDRKRSVMGASAKLKASNRQFSAIQSAATAPVASWGGAAQPVAAASFPTASGLARGNTNRQANLSEDNFPSLGPVGGGTSRQPYAAANALFKQQQQQKKAPSLDSPANFPPPPAASQKSTVRDRILGGGGRETASLNTNVLQGPYPALSAKATVGDMKTTMGSVKYKALKRMTAEFASGGLDGQSYVDQAASLFEQGYGDADFWKFLPSLLASCPNENDARRALEYMEDLKRMKNAASNAESARAATQQPARGGGWNAPPSVTATAPPIQMAAGWNARAPVAHAPPIIRPGQSRVGAKKNPWGTGPSPSVTRVKKTPPALSVAAAAAAPTPMGSATKFMAQEAKQQKWQQANGDSNNKNGKKKKGKQKNELRDLAFGK